MGTVRHMPAPVMYGDAAVCVYSYSYSTGPTLASLTSWTRMAYIHLVWIMGGADVSVCTYQHKHT